MKHILAIDDDERLRDLLKRYLVKQGYSVTLAKDAATADKLMQSVSFDLLIVDVMMPGEDGVSFVKRIRPQTDVPIIMLTAKSQLDDRLDGFAAGIDDYLSKPFEPKELVVRIEAILRRANLAPQQTGIVVFGDYHYDFADQKLLRGDAHIELTRTERDMLSMLLQNREEVVERDALLQALNDDSNLRNVDVTITRLRKKIEDDPKSPRYIHTVRGQGYKISASS